MKTNNSQEVESTNIIFVIFMMPSQFQQEDLGMAYISAVVAKAGHGVEYIRRQSKVDGTIHDWQIINGNYRNGGHALQFELKSSMDYSISNNLVKYDLDVGAYNQLVTLTKDPNTLPQLLILFCMPKKSEDWLDITTEELILRKCCFYHQFNNALESQNKNKKTIEIPTSQQFTTDALNNLFSKLQIGERKLC